MAVCLAMAPLTASPTFTILETAEDFFLDCNVTKMSNSTSTIAYFPNCTALFQGLDDPVWMPLIIKYGRRPVYVIYVTAFKAGQ